MLSIVGDEDPRNYEVANDAFPGKGLDIFLCDNGHWFYLNPFGEVVNPYDNEHVLSYHYGEGSYYV